ncbi:hypothetical protein [Pseudoduganella sp. HUAS MS19]
MRLRKKCRIAGADPDPSKDRAMAPDGNMYFHPDDPQYSDDFSQASPGAQHTFIHELGHISQDQSGENVRSAAFDRDYKYWPLVEKAGFLKLNKEQRAEMVADYFLLQMHNLQNTLLNKNGPAPKLQDYERHVPTVYPNGNQE